MFCEFGKSSAIKLMEKVDFHLPEGSEKARTSECTCPGLRKKSILTPSIYFLLRNNSVIRLP